MTPPRVARGEIVGDVEGMLKLLFHREPRVLLGVHIIGEKASELIHIGQSVLTYGGTIDYFVCRFRPRARGAKRAVLRWASARGRYAISRGVWANRLELRLECVCVLKRPVARHLA